MWLYMRANVFILVLVISLWTPTNAKSEDNNEDTSEIFEPELGEDIEFLPAPRILGGRTAAEGQFPYQVSLHRGGLHRCGGAIISKNYILTAAHCVVSNVTNITYDASLLSIRAGSNKWRTGGSLHKVAEVKPHLDYYRRTNDIAVLRLAESLVLNGSIKDVPLGTSEVPSGSRVTVAGWGHLQSTNGSRSAQLQYNNLTALSTTECNRIRKLYTPASVLCLAHTYGNGVCKGDSGGPGVYNGRLVGISSFSDRTCGSKWPDGFTNVTYFIDWIRNNTDVKL